jgi:hypothetical protein
MMHNEPWTSSYCLQWLICQFVERDDGFIRSTNVFNVVAVVVVVVVVVVVAAAAAAAAVDDAVADGVVGIIEVVGSISYIFVRLNAGICTCDWCLRSALDMSMGVAGGELVSTFVVSRIVTSVVNERPQWQTKRCPWLILGVIIDCIGVDPWEEEKTK